MTSRSPRDGVTPCHQLERYDGSTGQLVAWVRVPVLSPVGASPLYMYLGDPRPLVGECERAVGCELRRCWHMDEPAWNARPASADATGTNPGTATGHEIANGKIGGAGTFDRRRQRRCRDDASLQPASSRLRVGEPQSVGSAPDRHPYMSGRQLASARLGPARVPRDLPHADQPRPTFYTGNARRTRMPSRPPPRQRHLVSRRRTRDATSGETSITER